MANTNQLAARLRAQCESLRRKPTPLADLIPLLQQAADEHDALVAATRALMGACGQASFCLRELLPDDSDAQLTVELLNGAMSKGRAALPPAPQES